MHKWNGNLLFGEDLHVGNGSLLDYLHEQQPAKEFYQDYYSMKMSNYLFIFQIDSDRIIIVYMIGKTYFLLISSVA